MGVSSSAAILSKLASTLDTVGSSLVLVPIAGCINTSTTMLPEPMLSTLIRDTEMATAAASASLNWTVHSKRSFEPSCPTEAMSPASVNTALPTGGAGLAGAGDAKVAAAAKAAQVCSFMQVPLFQIGELAGHSHLASHAPALGGAQIGAAQDGVHTRPQALNRCPPVHVPSA